MKKVIPRDLTLEQINQLFKACLPNESSEYVIKAVLFQKEKGFVQDSKAIYFDADKIKLAKPQLEYSMGQLKDVHLKRSTITTQSVTERYDNVQWAHEVPPIMAYLHMILAAELITPVDAKTGEMTITTEIIPTLCLFDENFPEWIRKNEAELSCKYYGQQ